jgi:hypothetical protein
MSGSTETFFISRYVEITSERTSIENLPAVASALVELVVDKNALVKCEPMSYEDMLRVRRSPQGWDNYCQRSGCPSEPRSWLAEPSVDSGQSLFTLTRVPKYQWRSSPMSCESKTRASPIISLDTTPDVRVYASISKGLAT